MLNSKEKRRDFFHVALITLCIICFIGSIIFAIANWNFQPGNSANDVATIATSGLVEPDEAIIEQPIKDAAQIPSDSEAPVGNGATEPQDADPYVPENAKKRAVYYFIDRNVCDMFMKTADDTKSLLVLARGIGQIPADGINENGPKIEDLQRNAWLKDLDTNNLDKYLPVIAEFLQTYRYSKIDNIYGVSLTDGKFVGRFKFDGLRFEVIPGYAIREDFLPPPTGEEPHEVPPIDPVIENDPPATSDFNPSSI